MANLRIVSDNAANRSTVTATSTAGTLVPANLITDLKSDIWRSTSTTATLTLTWTAAETVAMVALVFASLTPTATIRVRGYTNAGDPTPVVDTGTVTATQYNFGATLAANQYGFGGGVTTALYFTASVVKQVTILITDTSNTLGYVEAARVVAGNYWSPVNNCEVGCEVCEQDLSKHERSDAGDLRTDRGPRYKTLSFDLSYMPTADRNALWQVMIVNGMTRPVFISLNPDYAADKQEEQIFQIYGKQSRMSTIKYQLVNQFSSKLDIEEV